MVGYTGLGQAGHCEDIDECLSDSHCSFEGGVCNNKKGSYDCSCKNGFEKILTEEAGDGVICVDIDQCAEEGSSNPCPENSQCVNLQGEALYRCDCDSGYQKKDDICVDVNECLQGCDVANSVCTNLEGGHLCTCEHGFTASNDEGGMLEACTDIDECASFDLNICAENAYCTNQKSTYKCTCNDGFQGDGSICEDIKVKISIHVDVYCFPIRKRVVGEKYG
jgi:hypothetical protein